MRLTRSNHSQTRSDELAAIGWFAPLSTDARRALRREADRIDVAPGTRLQRQDARVQWVWAAAYHGMFAEPSFAVARCLAGYAESSSGASSTLTPSSSPAT